MIKETHLLQIHRESCVSFAQTKELFCADGITPLNKARNYQAVSAETGQRLCDLIDAKRSELLERQEAKQQRELERLPPPFLHVSAREATEHKMLWKALIEQVETKLGRVLLACPFGSQRYNCHTEQSDVDMFVVYQSPTSRFLGFTLPAMTIKVQYMYNVLIS